MDKQLLEILCCPQTRQALRQAEAAELDRFNRMVQDGRLKTVDGRPVSEKLDEALVRADGLCAYPVRDGIAELLVEDGILLESAG